MFALPLVHNLPRCQAEATSWEQEEKVAVEGEDVLLTLIVPPKPFPPKSP